MTGVYGVLDAANHIFTFSNFGHNPPVLFRNGGEVEFLTEGGIVLGVNQLASFEERALMMQPGDIIVMYTDGVTEVFDSDNKEFGSDGLIEIIKANKSRSSVEIGDAIRAAVSAHATTDTVYDDLTFVVLKRDPS